MQTDVLKPISTAERNAAKGKKQAQAAVVQLMLKNKRKLGAAQQPENVSATGTSRDLESQPVTSTNQHVAQLEQLQHFLRPCLHKVLFDLYGEAANVNVMEHLKSNNLDSLSGFGGHIAQLDRNDVIAGMEYNWGLKNSSAQWFYKTAIDAIPIQQPINQPMLAAEAPTLCTSNIC